MYDRTVPIMLSQKQIEHDIYATFADIASSLGYSEIHGRILAALFAAGRPLSLKEVAQAVGVSISAVSLSLDLLETLGMARRIKKPGDRNLYVQISGDLLAGLRTAFMRKLDKAIDGTLARFADYKRVARGDARKALDKLERESKRLKHYVTILRKVPL